MPTFLSEEEFRLIAHDPTAITERADAVIRDLRRQLDTVRAEADAGSISAEQSCAILEQKYSSLSVDFSRLQHDFAELSASYEAKLADVTNAEAQKQQFQLLTVEKDGEIERLKRELVEMQKSRRQLLELIENRDAEIHERNVTIQSYIDKIGNLTESNTFKDARLNDVETEWSRCRATSNRILEEKELLEKHNTWLNEEITAKVNELAELRRAHTELESNLSTNISSLERKLMESSRSSNRSKERVNELEQRVNSLEEALRQSKDVALANEERFTAELSTVSKLVELYKASSEEWSIKATELEGVIKALEIHMNQVENDYKGKLENEVSTKKDLEKEAANLRMKLEKCETEFGNTKKASELSLLPLSSFTSTSLNVDEPFIIAEADNRTTNPNSQIVPRVPMGVSDTALAASLLRDGWNLAKLYEKYQEAADAARHERWGRRHSEAILERVLHEIEAKADIILEERVEHERMTEAYTSMSQRLQESLLENENFERTIRQMKSELMMRERDWNIAQKEINDLEKQVTVLLKECQDIQIRCGLKSQASANNLLTEASSVVGDTLDVEGVISENLVTFKDINGLVEQNVRLRKLVRTLSCEEDKRDIETREGFKADMQKVSDEAAAKVEGVLKRSEEQAAMIEALHNSVTMYKKLYEEERKNHASVNVYRESASGADLEDGRELMIHPEGSQDVPKRTEDQVSERARALEHELVSLRDELLSLRSERDKMSLEANFAKERLDIFTKELDRQRQEADAVSARNVELSQSVVDFQRRLRECSDTLLASEENTRKLSMEVSVLKREREILSHSEKRASDEVRGLSERVHRLQSSLVTLQSTKTATENARATEKRKHEDYLRKVEMEWAEAKKELQEERDHVRSLTLDREKAVENSARQVEEMRKELADAWRSVAAAESRAAVAEARCSDLEGKITLVNGQKVMNFSNKQLVPSTTEKDEELLKMKEELENLKEEAQATKGYMLQYKEIAKTNETTLKQVESAHAEYKMEAENAKKALENEVQLLLNKVTELESYCKLKAEEAAFATERKDTELSTVTTETLSLREAISEKLAQIEILEVKVFSLKENLDKEHSRWRTAQDNYERQVILQSETIQELTNTSKELSSLQVEVVKLKEFSEAQKTENDLLKAAWATEKSELQHEKSELERKYSEINEQNKVLHNRLDALHVRLAEKEHTSSKVCTGSVDSQVDDGMQNIVNYLRRSKEIAETETSLLRQEKLRLQSQLESALAAAETAQVSFRSQCESSRSLLLKDEDFKSLQIQVREINLLRESNVQLRAENEHNYEECQKFRERALKAEREAENCESVLKEKQIKFDACLKEVEVQKLEIEHLNNRIKELRENYKNIDIEEYERLKNDLDHTKALLKENEVELQISKNLVSEKEETLSRFEQDCTKCQLEKADLEKKLSLALEAERKIKSEIESVKKMIPAHKKNLDSLTRETKELKLKNEALMKQNSKLSTLRKTTLEMSSEQAKKEQEKDMKLQTLERILEEEREFLRKEREDNKLKRKQFQEEVDAHRCKINADKEKVEEELSKLKKVIAAILEAPGNAASLLPSLKTLDDQLQAYLQSICKFEEFANSSLNDCDDSHSLVATSTHVDASPATSVNEGWQPPVQQVRAPSIKAIDEKEKGLPPKPRDAVRKATRRLVRPPLERVTDSALASEVFGVQGSTSMEETKPCASQDLEVTTDAPFARKRLASSVSELTEDPVGQDEVSINVAPSLKKSKRSEDRQEASSEEQSIIPSSETTIQVSSSLETSDMSESQPKPIENIEIDPAPELTSHETVTAEKVEDDTVIMKEETEDKQEAPEGTNEEDEEEADMVTDETDKPTTEMVDEDSNADIEHEVLQAAIESEDEMEEGELMLDDDVEQQQEEGADEPISQGGEIGKEAGNKTLEVPTAEVPVDKNEVTDTREEVTEASNKRCDPENVPDSSQSPQRPSGARERSPIPPKRRSVSQPRSPSPGPSTVVSEPQEPKPTVITLKTKAKENSRLRMSGMRGASSTSQQGGTSRSSSAPPNIRGTRRLRGAPQGGRGQSQGDKNSE